MRLYRWVAELPLLVKGLVSVVALSVVVALVVVFAQPLLRGPGDASPPSQDDPAPSGPNASKVTPPTVGHSLPDVAAVRCPSPGTDRKSVV